MREILKIVGALTLIALLLAHLFLIVLFFAPVPKVLGLFIRSEQSFVLASEIPTTVSDFLSVHNVEVMGDFFPEDTVKSKLVMGVLQLRESRFLSEAEKLALNMNLLDYGEGIIGLAEAADYYYKKPPSALSDKEWITLINLQKIFSKK